MNPGDVVVAEASSLVDCLDPEVVITPHPVVDYIVMGD